MQKNIFIRILETTIVEST